MTTTRVLDANCYRKNDRDVEAVLAEQGATVLLLQEVQGVGDVEGYTRYGGTIGHQREVAVYVRTDVVPFVVRVRVRKLSKSVGRRAVWHERYGVTVRVEEPGQPKRSYSSTHMLADIKDGGVVQLQEAGAREWIEQMKHIQRGVREERQDGYETVLGMDSNFYVRIAEGQLTPRRRASMWWWAPQRALRRVGLTWHYHGMDGVAVPSRYKKARIRSIKRALTGSDHLWLDLEF